MIRTAILTIGLMILLSPLLRAEIVVVTNLENDISPLSRSQLIDLYMGRNLYFENGTQALRLDHEPDSELRIEFYRLLIDKTVAEVNAYWARLLFTGRASPPHVLANSTSILNAVRNNKSAVGYIDADDVDDTVKILAHIQSQSVTSNSK